MRGSQAIKKLNRMSSITRHDILRLGDNGVAVPSENKLKIFERGFGNHTGLGLFLSRKIPGITGMAIAETGMPGWGACFEIRIPKGTYRFLGRGEFV
jgi:signal transduction histidine kinase